MTQAVNIINQYAANVKGSPEEVARYRTCAHLESRLVRTVEDAGLTNVERAYCPDCHVVVLVPPEKKA